MLEKRSLSGVGVKRGKVKDWLELRQVGTGKSGEKWISRDQAGLGLGHQLCVAQQDCSIVTVLDIDLKMD